MINDTNRKCKPRVTTGNTINFINVKLKKELIHDFCELEAYIYTGC